MLLFSKRLQEENIAEPISVTESAMVMLFKELPLAKAWLPISLTKEMVVFLKDLQPSKVLLPISLAELEMVILSKELQPWNAKHQNLN